MQEEDSQNIVSCNFIEADPQLINLFTSSEIHPKNIFDNMPPAQPQRNRFDHLFIKDAEI